MRFDLIWLPSSNTLHFISSQKKMKKNLIKFFTKFFRWRSLLSVCHPMPLIAHISSNYLHESTFHSISSYKMFTPLFPFFLFTFCVNLLYSMRTLAGFSFQQVQNVILSVENKSETRSFQCLRAFVCVCVHKLNGF